MSREAAICNEVNRVPIITGWSTISPFVELREKGTDKPLPHVFSVNVETGEVLVTVLENGIPKTDDDGRVILNTGYLNLQNYYLAFK